MRSIYIISSQVGKQPNDSGEQSSCSGGQRFEVSREIFVPLGHRTYDVGRVGR